MKVRSGTWLLIGLCLLLGTSASAKSEKTTEIQLPQRVRDVIEAQFKIYKERRIQEEAAAQVRRSVRGESSFVRQQMAENEVSAWLPICDTGYEPMSWRYVRPNGGQFALEYVGNRASGSLSLRWEDGTWARVSGADERFKKAIFCAEEIARGPSSANYLKLSMDQRLATNLKFSSLPGELTDRVLVSLSQNRPLKAKTKIRAEVRLAADVTLDEGALWVEIWGLKNSQPTLLVQASNAVRMDAEQSIVAAQADVEPGSIVTLILRMSPQLQQALQNGELTESNLYVLGASLTPM